jgi:prefoldin subunit 5
MSVEEVVKKIDECIQELGRFAAFSPDAKAAVEYLTKMKAEVESLTKQKAEQMLKDISEWERKAQAYAAFLPKTIPNLKFIKEWLQKKLPELK